MIEKAREDLEKFLQLNKDRIRKNTLNANALRQVWLTMHPEWKEYDLLLKIEWQECEERWIKDGCTVESAVAIKKGEICTCWECGRFSDHAKDFKVVINDNYNEDKRVLKIGDAYLAKIKRFQEEIRKAKAVV